MRPLDVRKKVDLIPMPIEFRGRSDKETIKRLKRTSPDVSKMKRIVDKDGTVWGFSSPAKARNFVANRETLLSKEAHFLSGREILNYLYSDNWV
jgi:hypothetical protein